MSWFSDVVKKTGSMTIAEYNEGRPEDMKIKIRREAEDRMEFERDRQCVVLSISKKLIYNDPLLYQFLSLVESATGHISEPKIDSETRNCLSNHLAEKYGLPEDSRLIEWTEAIDTDQVDFLMQNDSFRPIPLGERFPSWKDLVTPELIEMPKFKGQGSPGGSRPTIKKRKATFEI